MVIMWYPQQRRHAKIEEAVFSVWSVPKVYNRHGKLLGAVEFQNSKGAVVGPEDQWK
jgi:hypothetical protein